MDVCRPGRGVPGLAVARRHDVDMAIENQGPLPFDAEQPGDQDRLRALDFHSGKTRMPFQQGNIGLEAIHLEPRFLECERNQVLGGAFVARYRGDTEQILRQADARSSVECLEGSCLGPLSDHRVSVVAAPTGVGTAAGRGR